VLPGTNTSPNELAVRSSHEVNTFLPAASLKLGSAEWSSWGKARRRQLPAQDRKYLSRLRWVTAPIQVDVRKEYICAKKLLRLCMVCTLQIGMNIEATCSRAQSEQLSLQCLASKWLDTACEKSRVFGNELTAHLSTLLFLTSTRV